MTFHSLNNLDKTLIDKVQEMMRVFQYKEIQLLLDESNETNPILVNFIHQLVKGLEQIKARQWEDAKSTIASSFERAEELQFGWGIGYSLLAKTEIALHDRYYENAAKHGMKALDVLKRNEFYLGSCEALNALGRTFYLAGDYRNAIDRYNELVISALSLNDNLGQMKALINSGHIRMIRGDYKGAYENYFTALNVLEKSDIQGSVKRSCLCHLGNAQRSLGNYKDAIQIFLRGISDDSGISNPNDLADIHRFLGDTYSSIGQFEGAQYHFDKSLELLGNHSSAKTTPMVLNSIGDHLARQKRFSEAIQAYEEALKIIQENDHYFLLVKCSYISLLITINEIEKARKELCNLQRFVRQTSTQYGRHFVNWHFGELLTAEMTFDDARWTLFDTLTAVEFSNYGELIPDVTFSLIESLLSHWLVEPNQADFQTTVDEIETILTYTDQQKMVSNYLTALTIKSALFLANKNKINISQSLLEKVIAMSKKCGMELHTERAKYVQNILKELLESSFRSHPINEEDLQQIAINMAILILKDARMKLTEEKRKIIDQVITERLNKIIKKI